MEFDPWGAEFTCRPDDYVPVRRITPDFVRLGVAVRHRQRCEQDENHFGSPVMATHVAYKLYHKNWHSSMVSVTIRKELWYF